MFLICPVRHIKSIDGEAPEKQECEVREDRRTLGTSSHLPAVLEGNSAATTRPGRRIKHARQWSSVIASGAVGVGCSAIRTTPSSSTE
jgi:hypothetical protein